ncbi:MAG: two-component system sensor histidine kinase NtrB [Nitrospirota bacterium]
MSAEPIRAKLRWVIGLRVVVVTVFLGLFLALNTRGSDDPTTRLFGLLIVGTYTLTIVYALALKWLSSRWDQLFAIAQLAGDLACITVVVGMTGRIESPFTFLYPVVILAGTMVLGPAGGLVATVASSAIYAAVAWPSMSSVDVASWWAQRSGLTPVVMRVVAFVAVFLLGNHLVATATAATRRLHERETGFRTLSAFHENIVQSMSSGLVTADLNGRVTSLNPAAYTMLGLSPDDALGRPCWDLFAWEDGPDFYARVATRNVPYRFEREVARRDGRRVLLGMTLSWLKDSNGEPMGMVGTFQDLTEIKALEDAVHQRERLASVGELAAGLAHEIRNPLASISGAMEVLQQDLRLEGEPGALMGIVLRETERLDGLIGQFLLYARPASPRKRSCDLARLIRETLALLRTHHDFRPAVEVREHLSDSPVWVQADANQIRQVVWNLVLNALQAMPEGGQLSVRLRAVAAERGPVVHLTVGDTGHGIKPEDLPRMFVPFFTTKTGGSGLGLAIVHRIVEEHRGQVDVHSEWNKGTRITVTLPAGTSDESTRAADDPGVARDSAQAGAAPS